MKPNLKSREEILFWAWLQEAMKKDLVSDVQYEPKTFELIPRASVKIEQKLKIKTKMVDKFLFHPHKYTPDFVFKVNHMPLYQYFTNGFKNSKNELIYVDTKGTFLNRGAKQEFSINQKLMWQVHGIYVHKVVPKELFQDTWCPELGLWTEKGNPSKVFDGCCDLDGYLDGYLANK